MTDYDAIVVGGGHNGLTAGAYLARAGLRVCVVERRDILGGACVTEEVWPGHRISRASYVVSLLQPTVVKDLRLKDFGYEVHPLDPAYAAIDADGRVLFFHNDQEKTVESLARFSKKDAAALPAFEDLLERMAAFLRPLMLKPPPMIGSKRPGDLFSLLREAGRAAGLSKRDVHDFYRVMTMSVGDLLDDWFENDLYKGATASTGVVGVWAGPRTPGTAYNLLHHALGEIDGVSGLWGHVKGGMGAISMAIAKSAEASGATIRTGAGVRSIDVRDGRVLGVTLESGEELRAGVVVSGAHPKTTVLDLAGAEHFPDEVVEDLQRYKTRGGSVKVNWVLSEPPHYEGVTDEDRYMLLRSGVAFCPSIDYLERAWQDAVRGRPSEAPYLEVEVPTTIDDTLTDDGATVVTMFTQYGPYNEEGWPEGSRERYAQQCLDTLGAVAPNVKDAVVHHEVLAPPDLERIFGLLGGNIFQGEQGLDQMAFMRPTPALAQYSTPVDGLYLCGAGTHPGGGVMAAGGHNAAKKILHDQRWKKLRRAIPSRNGHATRSRCDDARPHGADPGAGRAPVAGAPVRRGGAVPARGEGRAGRRQAAGRGPRAHPLRGDGGRAARRAARPRTRRAGLVEARVGVGRGAVRALDQRPLVAHPDRVQRARVGIGGADRALAAAGAAGRGPRRLRGDRGARGLGPVGDRDDRAAPRRRLGDRRREVVRHLRRHRDGLHRRGERGGGGADAVPRRRDVAGDLRRRRPAVHAHLSARASDDPVRGGRGLGWRRDRRGRRRRRAPARVVHRGADRDRGARRRGDVAAARRGDRVGAQREQGGKRIMDHQGVSFPLADSAADAAAGRALTLQVARLCDAGADPKIVHAKASMAKLFVSEAAYRCADRAVQVFGGRGYLRTNVAERFLRELRVDRIWEGTSEIQRLIVARALERRGVERTLH